MSVEFSPPKSPDDSKRGLALGSLNEADHDLEAPELPPRGFVHGRAAAVWMCNNVVRCFIEATRLLVHQ